MIALCIKQLSSNRTEVKVRKVLLHFKTDCGDLPDMEKRGMSGDRIVFMRCCVCLRDGTTDITRTIHLGTPSQYEQECFTRVFKGQHFLGTSVFPSKTKVTLKHLSELSVYILSKLVELTSNLVVSLCHGTSIFP
jgi:hypothetical protein